MSQPIQARKWSEDYVNEYRSKIELLISGDSGIYYRTELLVEELGDLNDHGFYEIDGIKAVFLLNRAKTDFFAKEAIKIIIAQNIRSNQKIPDCWRELHASIVGEASYETSKGKRKETKDWRNFIALIMANELIDQFNLTFSTNPISRCSKSAVEIISEVMNKSGLTPIIEYSALERGIRRLAKSPSV